MTRSRIAALLDQLDPTGVPDTVTEGLYEGAESLLAALDRVEAEIARLQQEEVAQRAGHAVMFRQWERERERAEAAEAERDSARRALDEALEKYMQLEAEGARLRDGLRLLAERPFTAALDAREMRDQARALLADDGAACGHEVWKHGVCELCGAKVDK